MTTITKAAPDRPATGKKGTGAPKEKLASRTAAMIIMGVSTLYFLVPIWWLFISSTKSREQFSSTAALWFADFNLFTNIADLVAYNDGVYLKWMLNSILYAGTGALLGTLFAAMCGYALATFALSFAFLKFTQRKADK